MVREYTERIFKQKSPFGNLPYKPGLWTITTKIEAEDKYSGIPIPSLRLINPEKLVQTAELHLYDREEIGPHFLLDVRLPGSKKTELIAVSVDRDFIHGPKETELFGKTKSKVRAFSFKAGQGAPTESHPDEGIILQRLAELFWHAGKNAISLEKKGKKSENYPEQLKADALKRLTIALIHGADSALAKGVKPD